MLSFIVKVRREFLLGNTLYWKLLYFKIIINCAFALTKMWTKSINHSTFYLLKIKKALKPRAWGNKSVPRVSHDVCFLIGSSRTTQLWAHRDITSLYHILCKLPNIFQHQFPHFEIKELRKLGIKFWELKKITIKKISN